MPPISDLISSAMTPPAAPPPKPAPAPPPPASDTMVAQSKPTDSAESPDRVYGANPSNEHLADIYSKAYPWIASALGDPKKLMEIMSDAAPGGDKYNVAKDALEHIWGVKDPSWGVNPREGSGEGFQANRGKDSYVAPPAYVGQSVAANQTSAGMGVAQALRELKDMGPPQMWAPSAQAKNMARMKQLQDFIKEAQKK